MDWNLPSGMVKKTLPTLWSRCVLRERDPGLFEEVQHERQRLRPNEHSVGFATLKDWTQTQGQTESKGHFTALTLIVKTNEGDFDYYFSGWRGRLCCMMFCKIYCISFNKKTIVSCISRHVSVPVPLHLGWSQSRHVSSVPCYSRFYSVIAQNSSVVWSLLLLLFWWMLFFVAWELYDFLILSLALFQSTISLQKRDVYTRQKPSLY